MTEKERLKKAEEYQSFKPGAEKKDWNEYNGLDNLTIGSIQDDKIYALAHNGNIEDLENGKPIAVEYYFDQATYDKFVDPITGEFDAKALGEALQVKPYNNDEMTDGHAEYRNSIVCFERKGELNIPVGICEANTQFGGGGAHQAFIPAEEAVKWQEMGILKYNKEETNICTGKNYIIEKDEYAKIQFASNERCENCNENNLKHPQEIACQSGFELNEPIPGNPFNATYSRDIDKETTAPEVTEPKISTERYRLEIKNDNGYPPLPEEKAQTAKELAAELLNEQKDIKDASIHYVGNNTILVTDSNNIPFGNANLETGEINIADYETKITLNIEVTSKMDDAGKVAEMKSDFINEVNMQAALGELHKQLSEEQKNKPAVDRSKMSLKERRLSRAEAKGKFRDAKKAIYELKMELENELSKAKLAGMDSVDIEININMVNDITHTSDKMENVKEEFQNTQVTINNIYLENSQNLSDNKNMPLSNKIAEGLEHRLASDKATLIEILNEVRKINQKLDSLSAEDKAGFNEKVSSINQNRTEYNHSVDKVLEEDLDKMKTALKEAYPDNPDLEEIIQTLDDVSQECKRDMKETHGNPEKTVQKDKIGVVEKVEKDKGNDSLSGQQKVGNLESRIKVAANQKEDKGNNQPSGKQKGQNPIQQGQKARPKGKDEGR